MSDEQHIRESMSAALDERALPEHKERAMRFLDWCLSREYYVVPADDEDDDA